MNIISVFLIYLMSEAAQPFGNEETLILRQFLQNEDYDSSTHVSSGLTKTLHVIDAENDKKATITSHYAKLRVILNDMKCKKQGRYTCAINCSQGKFHHRDGCCHCVCKKNYFLVGSTECKSALWSKWNNWSKCIETEWGGLQTRERICESGGWEASGSCDGRGSDSKSCSRVTGDFTIRKNINALTHEEVHDLIQAMTKLKADSSKRGYRNIISWHGWPGRCPWYHHLKNHQDNHCSFHHHPLFLPWHRLITLQMELGLKQYLKNKTLGIPYWDWTQRSRDIPYLIRHQQIYDPIESKYVDNPFHKTFIMKVDDKRMYSKRSIWIPGVLMYKYILRGTVRALLSRDYYTFDEQLAVNPHDQIHNCMCVHFDSETEDDCLFGMPSVQFAAFDPLFFLHHSAIDRVFTMKRHLEEIKGVSDWTSSRIVGSYMKVSKPMEDVLHAYDWPLSPFCNKSMNPEIVTSRKDVWTLHNSYYNEQLFGYRYDNFDLGNYTWESLLGDWNRNNMRKFWNDEYFMTELGPLTQRNSQMKTIQGCVLGYHNPV